ncbi:MAG: flagellar hook-associated protein FlgK [Thermodesulfobacteriota bacterium]
MSGINNTLSIARSAIQSQQHGLSVTGHNISNVNNPEYSRQTLPMESSYPINYGGLIFGTGVTVDDINQVVNKYMETRLTDSTSNKSSLEESQNYMNVLDSLLNENGDSSISSLLSDFFGSWQDLSNNPGGSAERTAVYESGAMLSEELKALNNGLSGLQTDLTKEVEAGVEKVNEISAEIAKVNQAVLSQETIGQTANDLRDKRTGLIRELGEYIDVKTFEQPSGSTVVTTKSGHTLVYDKDTYGLDSYEKKVMWQGSYGNDKDITSKIQSGKLGGWLEMRDQTIPGLQSDLESLTKEMIWQVNNVHSQGAGEDYFDTNLTGEYKADDSGWLSTFDFGDKIDYSKDFKIWTKDSSSADPVYEDSEIDMDISTAEISNYRGHVTGSSKSAPPYEYKFSVVQGGTVDDTESRDDPVIRWEKYSGDGVRLKSGHTDVTEGTVNVDSTTSPASPGISFDIGSGKLVSGNTFSINTNELGYADPLDLEVDQLSELSSEQYSFKVVQAGNPDKDEVSGEIGVDPVKIEWSNSSGDTGDFTLSPKDPYFVPLEAEVDNMRFRFNSGTVKNGDMFVVNTDDKGRPSLEDQGDYKWTLNTFAEEFNKTVGGVRASVTPHNQLSIEPETDGFDISDLERTGNVHLPDTNVEIKNHSALSAADEDVNLTRDSEGRWTISGLDNKDYGSASIVPSPLEVTQTGGAANTTDSEYSFDVVQGGTIGNDEVILDWSNSESGASGQVTLPATGSLSVSDLDGMDLDFESGGELFKGESFTMTSDGAGNASVDQVPHDKGFGIDLTGDKIADIDIGFNIPVQGQGSLKFDISPDKGDYSYAFSDDKSENPGIMAAAGINTFFKGSDIKTMEINPLLEDINNIAASKVSAAERDIISSDKAVNYPVEVTSGTNDTISFTEGNSDVLEAVIKPSLNGGVYKNEDEMEILAADIEKALERESYHGIDYNVSFDKENKVFNIEQKRADDEQEVTFHWNSSSAGETLGFDPDNDVITPPADAEEGGLSESDNSNVVDLLAVQDMRLNIPQSTYARDGNFSSEPVKSTLEGYYRGMVGGLGVKAVNVERGLSFSETMVQRLTEDRDTVSGVSLDEEMINLTKFQHAYTVASKLLSVSDEMLQTLVNMR